LLVIPPVCLWLLGGLVFGVVFVFWLFFGGFLGLCWYWLATEWLECVENKRAQYRVMRNHYFVSHR